MPKESIHNKDGKTTIQWGKDSYVSIGVEKPDSSNITIANSSDGLKIQEAEMRSLWTDLDRKGINDLIRILRRARNQAYGVDE